MPESISASAVPDTGNELSATVVDLGERGDKVKVFKFLFIKKSIWSAAQPLRRAKWRILQGERQSEYLQPPRRVSAPGHKAEQRKHAFRECIWRESNWLCRNGKKDRDYSELRRFPSSICIFGVQKVKLRAGLGNYPGYAATLPNSTTRLRPLRSICSNSRAGTGLLK